MIADRLLSPAIKSPLAGLTTSAATVGEVMDLGVERNNGLIATTYGPGWVITLKGGTSAGASTFNLSLITSAAANLSNPVTLWTGAAISLADTAAGKQYFLAIPSTNDWKRYAAFRAQAGTAVFTGGEFSIEFVADFRNWRAYPSVGNR